VKISQVTEEAKMVDGNEEQCVDIWRIYALEMSKRQEDAQFKLFLECKHRCAS
jgi:hypothetical protein